MRWTVGAVLELDCELDVVDKFSESSLAIETGGRNS